MRSLFYNDYYLLIVFYCVCDCVCDLDLYTIYCTTNSNKVFWTWARSAHLHQGILAQQRAGQGGRGPQEPRVRHLLDRLPDGQDQSGVDEGHDDVGVKLVCWKGARGRGRRKGPLSSALDWWLVPAMFINVVYHYGCNKGTMCWGTATGLYFHHVLQHIHRPCWLFGF